MLVPPPAQMGASSDLQPYSAAGPEQSQAFPAPLPSRSLSPMALKEQMRRSSHCSYLPEPHRSAMTAQRLNHLQSLGMGGGRQ